MKIVALSDTHGQHRQYPESWIPDGDVLIHAGDFTKHGRINELKDFLQWFTQFPHEHKIFIAGNHDICMQNAAHTEGLGTLPDPRQEKQIKKLLKKAHFKHNIHYLHNQSKKIKDKTFYGSPYSNSPPGWAFNTAEEEDKNPWNQIMDDTEILITHGPAKGLNDRTARKDRIGCPQLKEKLQDLNDLKLHLYGHNHNQYGKSQKQGNSYNVSILDEQYNIAHKPVVINL